MAGMVIVRIEGLEALRAKLTSGRVEAPVKRFLDRSAIYVQTQARMKAPVDTGRLRNSIDVESPNNRSRRVGTNLDYAPYVEFGTRPHFPPVSAITPWARRHGADPFTVARAISRKGTKEQPYLRPAAESAEGFIRGMVPILAAEIEAAYS